MIILEVEAAATLYASSTISLVHDAPHLASDRMASLDRLLVEIDGSLGPFESFLLLPLSLAYERHNILTAVAAILPPERIFEPPP